MRKAIVLAVLCLILASAAHGASEFTYEIPDGWINVTDRGAPTVDIPDFVVREGRSGKYVLYAVDPRMTSAQGSLVSFNAIEQAGSGRVTQAMVDATAAEMTRGVARSGFTMNVKETKVAKLRGTDIGVVTSVMETPRGALQLVQYMIPGKTSAAVLTYGCPPAEIDRYRPIFESSAMATTGVYDHGGFNFKSIGLAGVLGAIVAVVIGVVATSNKKKPAQVAYAAPAAPMVWDCPTCKRRVPMRLDECRCGAARPA
ncbi:MAG TPA: hypothetical protein VJ276_22815 [Thermoanaerobaculia bacterium]|nr:hypothetical protein [Thermoanaerobaculia bacterium]